MNNSIFTSFQDNNFEDPNIQSIVVAIANMSLTSINEYIVEAGLDQTNALNATTSAITALWLDMGRKFSDLKKALKPKEKFRDLVEAMGKPFTLVNKLIRATKVASNFPMTTAYMLGIDILARLAQPKYADLIDDFINHPPENQLEASDRIKEFVRSQPKKPKTPWLLRGSHKTTDGLPREYQAPIVSETVGLIIEQESENAGMPPRVFVEKAVQAFVEQASDGETKIRALLEEELEVQTARANEYKATAEHLELLAEETDEKIEEIIYAARAIPVNLLKTLLPIMRKVGTAPLSPVIDDLSDKRVTPKSLKKVRTDKTFAISETVMYCGIIYTIVSALDADGNVECKMANGRSRHIPVQLLKKIEVS